MRCPHLRGLSYFKAVTGTGVQISQTIRTHTFCFLRTQRGGCPLSGYTRLSVSYQQLMPSSSDGRAAVLLPASLQFTPALRRIYSPGRAAILLPASLQFTPALRRRSLQSRLSSSFFRKDSLQANAIFVAWVPSYTFGSAFLPSATYWQKTSISFRYASCHLVIKS